MTADTEGIDPATVCAIFVTFGPDEGLAARVAALAGQVGSILLVDNGSGPEGRRRVTAAAERSGARVIANAENLGIATALNQAALHAAESGCRWLLCLDQDATPMAHMVGSLDHAYRSYPGRARIGMIGSSAFPTPLRCHDKAWVEEGWVITSGSLLSLAAYAPTGRFRDDFFIDYVDVEYCLRLRAHGYSIIRACQPAMLHDIGRPRRHRFLGRWPTTTDHPAWRRYYITRNRILVWRAYATAEPGVVLCDLGSFIRTTLKLLLFERDRGAKARSLARGVRDAARGRTGTGPPTRQQEGSDVTRGRPSQQFSFRGSGGADRRTPCSGCPAAGRPRGPAGRSRPRR